MRPLVARALSLLLLVLALARPAFAQPVESCDPSAGDAASALASDVGAAAAASVVPGPVPDFASMAGIVVHSVARDVAGPISSALVEALGDRLVISSLDYRSRGSYTDPNYVWARDYHPIYVRQADGSLKVVSYLSLHPVKSAHSTATYEYVPTPSRYGARPDPSTQPPAKDPLFRVPGDPGPVRRLKHETMPLLLEGGNVLSTGRHVIVSEKVIADNAVERRDPHLVSKGYKARSREETIATLAASLSVKPEDVIVLPSLPGERTKHVDLFLLPLGENEIAVPEIRDEAIDAIGYGHEKDLGRDAQRHLNEAAAALAAKGYTVTRLPMMPAVNLAKPRPSYAGERVPDEWLGSYYSPANTVLADVDGKKRAFVPTFAANGFPDGYRELSSRYADEWTAALAARGWDASKVDATELGKANGLFRCITATIPK